MARYTDSVCKLCRRESMKLFLKGERCISEKCAFERRGYPPGQHGPGLRRRKPSDYSIQLREKQKVKRIYGVGEAQFRNYFEKAARARGTTGEVLLLLLETRLDNVVYRLGFASSRPQARQVVRHRQVMVNGRIVDIPSYQVKRGDQISLHPSFKKKAIVKNLSLTIKKHNPPSWLELNKEKLEGKVTGFPSLEEASPPAEIPAIFEFYSR